MTASSQHPARRRPARPTSTQLRIVDLLIGLAPPHKREAYIAPDGDVYLSWVPRGGAQLRRRVEPDGVTIPLRQSFTVRDGWQVIIGPQSTLGV